MGYFHFLFLYFSFFLYFSRFHLYQHEYDVELFQLLKKCLIPLEKFQIRALQQTENKKKTTNRRFKLGLGPLLKSIKSGNCKCALIAIDIESTNNEGHMDNYISDITHLAHEKNIPFAAVAAGKKLASI